MPAVLRGAAAQTLPAFVDAAGMPASSAWSRPHLVRRSSARWALRSTIGSATTTRSLPRRSFVARSGASVRGRAREYGELSAALAAALDRIEPLGRALDRAAEEELARFCYALALYEECRRMGLRGGVSPLDRLPLGADVADVLALAPGAALDDLSALVSVFHDSELAAWLGRPVVANPTLAGAGLVGGADGDVILGRFLVDLKVTTQPFERWWAYQLIGYALLDLDGRYALEEVGLYHARVGALITWPLQELLEEAAGLPVDLGGLRADFLAALGESPCQ